MTLGTSLPARLPESSGTVYYVDQAIGNDANTTVQAQSTATPWLTIGHAISAVGSTAGAIIRVRNSNGTSRYAETINWAAVGSSGNPITIENYPGETPVSTGVFNFASGGQYLRVRGFRFEASPATPDNKACLWFKSGASDCEAYGCTVTHPRPSRPTPSNTATTGGFLTGNTTYFYRVAAVTNEGTTIPSFENSITTAAGTNTNVVTLSWSAWTPPSGVTLTGYKVYRSTTVGTETLLASPGNVTSYVDNTNTAPSGAFLSQTSGIYWGDAPGPTNCQVWNCHVYNCGTDRNLDHGMYVGYGSGHLVANTISHDNYCHGLKFAPYVLNGIGTNNTLYHNGYGPAASAPVVGSGIIGGGDNWYAPHNTIWRNNICKDNASYGFRDFWDSGGTGGAGSNVTGNTHTSTTVDGITSTGTVGVNGFFVGQKVTGSGFPAGTTIATVNQTPNATSITLNQATTSTLTGTTITFGGDITADKNITHGNATGDIGVFTNSGTVVNTFDRSAGNQTATDPLLVDPSNGNFALQSNSPAINAGNAAYTPTFDYNGNTRINPDIGAIAATSSTSDSGTGARVASAYHHHY